MRFSIPSKCFFPAHRLPFCSDDQGRSSSFDLLLYPLYKAWFWLLLLAIAAHPTAFIGKISAYISFGGPQFKAADEAHRHVTNIGKNINIALSSKLSVDYQSQISWTIPPPALFVSQSCSPITHHRGILSLSTGFDPS